MEIFLREAPLHLDALGVAVTQGNAAQIETVAHTMKGELGYLGVPEISRKARDLEAMGHAKNLSGAFSLFPLFQAEVCALFRSVRSSRATHGTEAQGAHDLY
jgi:HPt (histidine-containing phosphotransfer) domain-containing protein